MNYSEIIRDNCENNSDISWWPRFAFHYTDVKNAANILSSGYLYSRFDATHRGIMENDNASRQVIDMTNSSVISKVRFYFRPLTPTQYYNEGYKHPSLRYDEDENANVPVPVFLLFDLEKLLSIPGVQFSETSQAGHGTSSFSGIEAFSKLNFKKIYDNSFENFEETKPFRHAEITHPNSMGITSCIRHILCRSAQERTTLLNLLMDRSHLAFSKYQGIIKVYNDNTFFNNGFYVSECSYLQNKISISFSDNYKAKQYIERMMEKTGLSDLKPIKVTVWLKWFNSRTIIKKESIDFYVDVRKHGVLTISGLPDYTHATDIGVEVYFDDKLVSYSVNTLKPSELLK